MIRMRQAGPMSDRQVLALHDQSVAPLYAGRLLADMGASVRWARDARLPITQVEQVLLDRGAPIELVSLEAGFGVGQLVTPGETVVVHGTVGPDLRNSVRRSEANLLQLSWVSPGERGGSDAISQAVAGVAHVVGEPELEPLWFPHNMGSYILGANAAGAALLLELLGDTSRTIQISLADLWAYAAGTNWMLCVPKGIPYVREGRRSPGNGGVYPQRIYRCKDGFVTLLCRSTSDWRNFTAAIGSPPWSRQPRYNDLISMASVYADEVDELVEAEMANFTRLELFDLARTRGFPLAPVRTPEEASKDIYLRKQNFWQHAAETTIPGSLWRRETWIEGKGARGVPPLTARVAQPITSALSGLRIIDLSWVWAGPMTASFFADLGAEVIKVEHEARLDNMRLRGRLGHFPDGQDPREIDPLFHNVNRGKKSIKLDMKDPQGLKVFLDLVRHSDAVIESFRPHVLRSWGIEFERLQEVNPKIVLLSMRGLELSEDFGPSGLRSYAPITSSLSGLESTIRYPGASAPTGGMGVGISDPVAGWHGITLLLAALVSRQRRGNGGLVRLSQLETLSSVLLEMFLPSDATDGSVGTRSAVVRCFDGDLVMAATDAQWEAITRSGHVRREGTGLRCDRSDLALGVAEASGATAVPVLAVEEHQSWLQRYGRTILKEVEHTVVGAEQLYVYGWSVGGEPITPSRSAPIIGEHTNLILTDVLGYSAEQIKSLEKEDVLK
jgi:crotonobetainyl-CoA:carnitine CoA-transferase CaiB-like acyl-CoA transferase